MGKRGSLVFFGSQSRLVLTIGEKMTLLLMLLACGEKEQAEDSSIEASQQEDTGVEA